ncbi:deoxynucleotidyltransferase terminal-interacting protein 2 [Cimex lectularius]|uniref:Fcf2 pre-rRNA processing C-terminal domain-containing protein n=1 Tax=Cimex lectularius TaxID=79782 RepID=A0A8I6RAB1_CIMLE|nr:deoxynucleotidyltransferase terminal-interacting protein 2 [Cimex lectularius]
MGKGDLLDSEDVYVSLGMTSEKNNIKQTNGIEEVLKKSILNTPLEKHTVLPHKERTSKRKKKKPKQELPEEVKTDVEVLKMRSIFDSKHFYKKNDLKNLSKDIQVGKVLDSPADFYHSRLPKKMRKPTLVDELLADDKFQKEVKKRYVNIIEQKRTKFRKEYKKLQNKYRRKTQKS